MTREQEEQKKAELRRKQAKAQLRDAPRVQATFDAVDAEYRKMVADLAPVRARRESLLATLTQNAALEAEFGDSETKTGEPAPAPSPAAKPKSQGTKK